MIFFFQRKIELKWGLTCQENYQSVLPLLLQAVDPPVWDRASCFLAYIQNTLLTLPKQPWHISNTKSEQLHWSKKQAGSIFNLLRFTYHWCQNNVSLGNLAKTLSWIFRGISLTNEHLNLTNSCVLMILKLSYNILAHLARPRWYIKHYSQSRLIL